MKAINSHLCCLVTILLLSIVKSNAQAVDVNPSILKSPPSNITVDGDLKDWSDSLRYFNAENDVRYTIANDRDNLYLAVRIEDRYEIARILKAGLTLSIDPKGKKKNAYSITFPQNVSIGNLASAAKPEVLSEVTQADRDELQREIITTLRGIKVEGFKDIDGDMITTSNTYGIKTAINYDAKGNFVCEASIDLKLFHLDAHAKNDWLFDIKINGIVAPNLNSGNTAPNISSGGRGGRGGMGGGGGGRGGRGGGGNSSKSTNAAPPNGSSELGKTVDFSGKFTLSAL